MTPSISISRSFLLQAEHLAWGFERPLVSDLSFDLAPGEIMAVVGPNGVGKTTLLRTLCGLAPLLDGEILLEGTPVAELGPTDRARRVAMLPQEMSEESGLTVRELVELGRTPHLGLWGILREEDRRAVDEALALCELRELADRRLDRLSGGERQRARIALAVAQGAPLLFLDEPSNHLDLRRRHELFSQLSDLRRRRNLAVLMVLHDLGEAYREAQRVLVLSPGHAEEIVDDDPQRREKLARAFDVPLHRIDL